MKDPNAAPVFRKVAVMGAGAVGSFFGAMLARAGHAVTLIGRPAHVQAIQRDGLQLQMGGQRTPCGGRQHRTGGVPGADLVLFCVKSADTEAVARQMAPLLEPTRWCSACRTASTTPPTLARHLPCRVVPTVVYVATAHAGPGVVRHFGRGDLVIGPLPGGTQSSMPRMAARCRRWSTCSPARRCRCASSPDVTAELWTKLLVNCAYNAISGLAQLPYGRLAALPDIRAVQQDIVREVVAVAAGQRRQPAAGRVAGRRWRSIAAGHAGAAVVHRAGHGAAASPARSTTSTASSRAAARSSACRRRSTGRCRRWSSWSKRATPRPDAPVDASARARSLCAGPARAGPGRRQRARPACR